MSSNHLIDRQPDTHTGWKQSIDWLLGNPHTPCICGHERQQHGKIMGVNGRGECVADNRVEPCRCPAFKEWTGGEGI